MKIKALLGLAAIFPFLVAAAGVGIAVKKWDGTKSAAARQYVWPMWQSRTQNTQADFDWHPENDECGCIAIPMYGKFLDVDQLHTRVQITSSDDLVEVGLYSEDGLTQYFEQDVVVSGAGDEIDANSIAAPGLIEPQTLWYCVAVDDNDGDGVAFRWAQGMDTALNNHYPQIGFEQACADGELPDAITVPGTLGYDAAGSSEMPFFRFNDDPTS